MHEIMDYEAVRFAYAKANNGSIVRKATGAYEVGGSYLVRYTAKTLYLGFMHMCLLFTSFRVGNNFGGTS